MKFYHTLNIKMQNIFVFKKPPLTVRQTIVCFSRHFLNLEQNVFLRKESPASWSVQLTQAASCVVREGRGGRIHLCCECELLLA